MVVCCFEILQYPLKLYAVLSFYLQVAPKQSIKEMELVDQHLALVNKVDEIPVSIAWM